MPPPSGAAGCRCGWRQGAAGASLAFEQMLAWGSSWAASKSGQCGHCWVTCIATCCCSHCCPQEATTRNFQGGGCGGAHAAVSLGALVETLTRVYEQCGFSADASVTPLQMLAKVEVRLLGKGMAAGASCLPVLVAEAVRLGVRLRPLWRCHNCRQVICAGCCGGWVQARLEESLSTVEASLPPGLAEQVEKAREKGRRDAARQVKLAAQQAEHVS